MTSQSAFTGAATTKSRRQLVIPPLLCWLAIIALIALLAIAQRRAMATTPLVVSHLLKNAFWIASVWLVLAFREARKRTDASPEPILGSRARSGPRSHMPLVIAALAIALLNLASLSVRPAFLLFVVLNAEVLGLCAAVVVSLFFTPADLKTWRRFSAIFAIAFFVSLTADFCQLPFRPQQASQAAGSLSRIETYFRAILSTSTSDRPSPRNVES